MKAITMSHSQKTPAMAAYYSSEYFRERQKNSKESAALNKQLSKELVEDWDTVVVTYNGMSKPAIMDWFGVDEKRANAVLRWALREKGMGTT